MKMYAQYDSNFEILVHPMFYTFLYIYLFRKKRLEENTPKHEQLIFFMLWKERVYRFLFITSAFSKFG